MGIYCNNCGSPNIVITQDPFETSPVVKIKCNDCHCEYKQLISSFFNQTAPPVDISTNHKITLDEFIDNVNKNSINENIQPTDLHDCGVIDIVKKVAVQIVDEEENFLINQSIGDIKKNLHKYNIDELYYMTREDIKKVLLLGLEKLKEEKDGK